MRGIYTGAGQLYSTKDHIAGLTAIYNYDQLGRLLDKTTRSSSTDAFRQSVSYLYDGYNRVSKIYYNFPGMSFWHERYSYNNDDGTLSSFRCVVGDEYGYANTGVWFKSRPRNQSLEGKRLWGKLVQNCGQNEE